MVEATPKVNEKPLSNGKSIEVLSPNLPSSSSTPTRPTPKPNSQNRNPIAKGTINPKDNLLPFKYRQLEDLFVAVETAFGYFEVR
jgi:hypothetical protein